MSKNRNYRHSNIHLNNDRRPNIVFNVTFNGDVNTNFDVTACNKCGDRKPNHHRYLCFEYMNTDGERKTIKVTPQEVEEILKTTVKDDVKCLTDVYLS